SIVCKHSVLFPRKWMVMEILELMAENEENIAHLYRLYAEKLPKYGNFWSRLADEETEHASMIRKFAAGVEKGTYHLDEKRFPPGALQTYEAYLDGSMQKAIKVGVDVMSAFTTALYIEESLIELKFFEIIDSGSDDFDEVLLRLKKDTGEHSGRIKEYWTKIKDSNREDIF
ncbi:ferritin family protein, partial [Chloroflexota bacterium]